MADQSLGVPVVAEGAEQDQDAVARTDNGGNDTSSLELRVAPSGEDVRARLAAMPQAQKKPAGKLSLGELEEDEEARHADLDPNRQDFVFDCARMNGTLGVT